MTLEPLANQLRNAAAAIFRSLPNFRGIGHCYRFVNAILLKAGASSSVLCRLRDGSTLRLDMRTHTEVEAFYQGVYEHLLIDTILSLADEKSVFVDIGSNIGFYTVGMALQRRGTENPGKIYSFEPLPGNTSRLRENIALNDLDHLCVHFPFGLSDTNRSTELFLMEDFLLGSSTGNASLTLPPENKDQCFGTAEIELRRLDDLREHFEDSRIDFIKLDVEGHEGGCLRGGKDLIARHRPTILMEVNKALYGDICLNTELLSGLPNQYLVYKPHSIYRGSSSNWVKITSLDECKFFDNVLCVPAEKAGNSEYARLVKA